MLENINKSDLVDIATVSVDKNLPPKERYAEYERQLKTPRHYISGKYKVTEVHSDNGKSLEDCLREMMAQKTARLKATA